MVEQIHISGTTYYIFIFTRKIEQINIRDEMCFEIKQSLIFSQIQILFCNKIIFLFILSLCISHRTFIFKICCRPIFTNVDCNQR